ncbi:hypothetical protein BD770DRAFT_416613, partial [Pilaira anomala]
MEEVYDLHQHSHCALISLGDNDIIWSIISNVSRVSGFNSQTRVKDYIIYNKEKTEALFWEIPYSSKKKLKEQLDQIKQNNEDYIQIENSVEKLYTAYQKRKCNWDEDDIFLEKAVSDFLRLVIHNMVETQKKPIDSFDALHYVCVVPSVWDKKIREELLRPIFIQSGVISENDHKNRLLFFSDIESIFYRMQNEYSDPKVPFSENFKVGDHKIMCRVNSLKDDTVSIHLDLVEIQYPLLDITYETLRYPRILLSSSAFITLNDIKKNLETFLKAELFLGNTNVNQHNQDVFYENNRTISTLMIPFIEIKEEWMLNDLQSSYLKALSYFDICSKFDKNILESMKRLASSSSRKYCDIFICYRENKTGYSYEMRWTEAILKSVSYDSSKIGQISHYEEILDDITKGATFYIRDAIHISDIQSRPHISSKYTLLSYSTINSKGFVESTLDNSNIISNNYLPPLGLFFNVSNVTTLNVNRKFTTLVEKYLNTGLSSIDFLSKDLLSEFKDIILEENYSVSEPFVIIYQARYIKAFLLIYFAYINEVISSSLHPQLNSGNAKIGYLVSVEKSLLD